MNTPQQSTSLMAETIAKQVTKLKSRRKRSGIAAWIFVVSAIILILALIVTKGDPPDLAFTTFGLILIWTIVESALVASSVCVSPTAVFFISFGGFCTYGVVSV